MRSARGQLTVRSNRSRPTHLVRVLPWIPWRSSFDGSRDGGGVRRPVSWVGVRGIWEVVLVPVTASESQDSLDRKPRSLHPALDYERAPG